MTLPSWQFTSYSSSTIISDALLGKLSTNFPLSSLQPGEVGVMLWCGDETLRNSGEVICSGCLPIGDYSPLPRASQVAATEGSKSHSCKTSHQACP